MSQSNTILHSQAEDFWKLFALTFIAFALSFHSQFLTSIYVVLGTVYFLDAGHVYSTLIEVYADPQEVGKPYVWKVTLLSFLLNLFVLVFFYNQFFYYIFYFTVFHNMRQGLGISLIYKRREKQFINLFKWSYYFLTIMPFILFHFRQRGSMHRLTDAIIRPVELSMWFSEASLLKMLHWGEKFYLLGAIGIISFFIIKKLWHGLLAMLFFFAIYGYAFLISENEFRSYLIFITSHAIPYYFFMHKRIVRTHSLVFVRKFAYLVLIFFFILGGFMDYYQNSLAEYFDDIDILIRSVLSTPLIAHFIFDAILWKNDNEKFQQFLRA